MNYKIFITLVLFIFFGCKGNNPIESSDNNSFELEYYNYFGTKLIWTGDYMGIKIIVTNDDSIKYFNIYANGISQNEEQVLEEKLNPAKKDSILNVFIEYNFYNYPSYLSQKDTLNVPARTVFIKLKREKDLDYKKVDATLGQGKEYYPNNFMDFLNNLDSVLGLQEIIELNNQDSTLNNSFYKRSIQNYK